MTAATCHSGPPPAEGWYPAGYASDAEGFRYWNGERWSLHATKEMNERTAGILAKQRCSDSAAIVWRHQPREWPAHARTYDRPEACVGTVGTG